MTRTQTMMPCLQSNEHAASTGDEKACTNQVYHWTMSTPGFPKHMNAANITEYTKHLTTTDTNKRLIENKTNTNRCLAAKQANQHAGTTNMASHDWNPTRTLQKMSGTLRATLGMPNNATRLPSHGRDTAEPITLETLKLSGERYKQKRWRNTGNTK